MKDGKEIRWWCHGCMEDQTDDVFDHWNRATGEALCEPCAAKKSHNAGPEHYCPECLPGGPKNDKTIDSTGAAALDNGNQRDVLSDSLPELLQIPNDLI